MAITVKHNKVSTIPDTTDTSLVRPSDWNADHTLVGTIDVANGGTGASTLTGYVKGNGTSAMTAVATVPSTDITGLGTMSTQNANAVAITGGTINDTTIGATTATTGAFTTLTSTGGAVNGTVGATTPATGKFSTLESTGTGSFGTTSAQYIQAVGNALYPQILAVGSGTNIPLVLQPKGTGALQAQLTDSTATGGNARGANAVDWQTSRATAAQVVSGSYSAILGGYRNACSGNYSIVVGGENNNTTSLGAFIGAGYLNAITNSGTSYSAIVGGVGNSAHGIYNMIGGGYTNSGTSASAVTTQSGTMNATTAVTLSGSNANIKVGQYITGTSIGSDTYVAAISGTSLTLSKVASGSSTSTLSFFTPHGVVVGGGNNQATGSYSFIGGGGDAGSAANRNVASGDWSTVGGGRGNQSTGSWSTIGGGSGNANYAGYTTIAGGLANSNAGFGSSVLGGYGNAASGAYSSVLSGSFGSSRSINSITTFSACSPISGTLGLTQASLLILAIQTTTATATVLTSDGGAASTVNQVILPNNSAYYFKGAVIAGVTGAGDTKGWSIEGVIKRGAGVGTTVLVGSTVTSLYADAGAATWAVTATADTTNGGLKITVTGQASTTIRWVCELDTTEMTY